MGIEYGRLEELLQQSRDYTRAMHDNMDRASRAYALEYNLGVKIPADTPRHVPSTAPSIVDHFVDQIRTGNPTVKLGPIRKGRKGDEWRGILEGFAKYALDQVNTHEDDPLWDYLAFELALSGGGCIRVLFDEELWPDAADRDGTEWPFATRVVHPKNVFICPGHRWPYAYVIEVQHRFLGELKADYGDWSPGPDKNDLIPTDPTTDMEVLIYWDNEEYTMFAGGRQVFSKPNLLGIPPYVWGFSGLGHKGEEADPEHQAVGIIHHVLSELESEARLMTAVDSLWIRHVWPALFGTVPTQEFITKMSAGAGRYIEIKSMEDMPKFLPPPEINPAMWALLPRLKESIQNGTYSLALEGDTGNTRYGVLYGMQVGQARLRVDAVKNTLERLVGRVIGLYARYVDKVLDGGLKVNGKTVDKTDIQGHYDFRVKFEAIDPLDNQQRINTGIQLYAAHAISRHMLLRDFLGLSDITSEEDQRLVETAIEQLVANGYLSQPISGQVNRDAAQKTLDTNVEQVQNMADRAAQGQPAANQGRGAPFGPRDEGTAPTAGYAGTDQTAKLGGM